MKYSYRSRAACYRDFYFTMEECRDCYYLTKCIELGPAPKEWRQSLEDE